MTSYSEIKSFEHLKDVDPLTIANYLRNEHPQTVAVVLAHMLPQWQPTFSHLNWLGKRGMVVALFLIGSNISLGEVKKAGSRSFVLGILLWIFIASLSLLVLHKFSAI